MKQPIGIQDCKMQWIKRINLCPKQLFQIKLSVSCFNNLKYRVTKVKDVHNIRAVPLWVCTDIYLFLSLLFTLISKIWVILIWSNCICTVYHLHHLHPDLYNVNVSGTPVLLLSSSLAAAMLPPRVDTKEIFLKK